jgi:hypothetical protein
MQATAVAAESSSPKVPYISESKVPNCRATEWACRGWKNDSCHRTSLKSAYDAWSTGRADFNRLSREEESAGSARMCKAAPASRMAAPSITSPKGASRRRGRRSRAGRCRTKRKRVGTNSAEGFAVTPRSERRGSLASLLQPMRRSFVAFLTRGVTKPLRSPKPPVETPDPAAMCARMAATASVVPWLRRRKHKA